jgi:two-component system sensor histidine kinase ChvG
MVDPALRESRDRRGFVSLNRSPLARKIILFNLLALVVMAAGVLFLNPFRDSLLLQRNETLITETLLVSDVFEAVAAETGGPLDSAALSRVLQSTQVGPGVEAFVMAADGALVDRKIGAERAVPGIPEQPTLIVDTLTSLWTGVTGILSGGTDVPAEVDTFILVKTLLPAAIKGEGVQISGRSPDGGTLFARPVGLAVDHRVEQCGFGLAFVGGRFAHRWGCGHGRDADLGAQCQSDR